MMDLDLDFDLEEDKIKSFLKDKLSEIKAKNEQLEQTLRERKDFSKGITEAGNTNDGKDDIKINAEIWRINNGKYVIGVTVINKTGRLLEDVKVLLTWSSKHPLSYQVHLYAKDDDRFTNIQQSVFCNQANCQNITESLKISNKIDKLAFLVISFDQPMFCDKNEYSVTGDIIFQQEINDVHIPIPPLNISSLDFTNHHLNDISLSEESEKDILIIASTSVRTDLVAIIPNDWSNSVDSTFEIMCSLMRIDVPSRCRKFFVARRLSPSFDNSLVEIHASNKEDPNIFEMTIYTRTLECLYPLLHHLHRHIPGVVIIPKPLLEKYNLQCRHDYSFSKESDNLDKFNESVDKEIKHVKQFLRDTGGSLTEGIHDVIKFRSDLADLERCTDLYHLRLRSSYDE